MTCEKGSDGVLLPDEQRLTKWGLFLRKTSLDELPELLNILKVDKRGKVTELIITSKEKF